MACGINTTSRNNLAKRCGHAGVKAVCTALTQAERYGTPLATALRVMALGEPLIAFRNSQSRLGVLEQRGDLGEPSVEMRDRFREPITRVLERTAEVRVEFVVTLGPPPGSACTTVTRGIGSSTSSGRNCRAWTMRSRTSGSLSIRCVSVERRSTIAFGVFDHFWFAAFEYRYARVGSTQVDADNFAHDVAPKNAICC